MFPWYPTQGHPDNNIKLAHLGLHLLWHLRLRVPFCHQCSFTSLFHPPPPHHHTHTHTNRRTGLTGWIFSMCSSGTWLSRRVGTCRGKRRGGVGGGWGGQSSLKLEGEWSSLAAVAARVSQVWSNGPTWPNLLLVVRWPAPVRGDKARGRLSHSFQPVFVKDSQWLSKNSQVGIQ